MFDLRRNLNGCIEVGVGSRRHTFHIVGGIGFVYAAFYQAVDRFIIGDGRFRFRIVDTDGIVA